MGQLSLIEILILLFGLFWGQYRQAYIAVLKMYERILNSLLLALCLSLFDNTLDFY